jgi:hypothetical protein
MFGGLRKQVDEYYFGYREVRLPNPNQIELPNPYLIRYLTTGNKAKAIEHWNAIVSQRDELVDLAVKNSGSSATSETLETQTMALLTRHLNQAGKDHVEKVRSSITKAISCAAIIALADTNRLGERPPVAKGIVIDAVGELGKKLSSDEDAMLPWAATIALYIIRSSKV